MLLSIQFMLYGRFSWYDLSCSCLGFVDVVDDGHVEAIVDYVHDLWSIPGLARICVADG
jgi:hypothetical protein